MYVLSCSWFSKGLFISLQFSPKMPSDLLRSWDNSSWDDDIQQAWCPHPEIIIPGWWHRSKMWFSRDTLTSKIFILNSGCCHPEIKIIVILLLGLPQINLRMWIYLFDVVIPRKISTSQMALPELRSNWRLNTYSTSMFTVLKLNTSDVSSHEEVGHTGASICRRCSEIAQFPQIKFSLLIQKNWKNLNKMDHRWSSFSLATSKKNPVLWER